MTGANFPDKDPNAGKVPGANGPSNTGGPEASNQADRNPTLEGPRLTEPVDRDPKVSAMSAAPAPELSGAERLKALTSTDVIGEIRKAFEAEKARTGRPHGAIYIGELHAGFVHAGKKWIRDNLRALRDLLGPFALNVELPSDFNKIIEAGHGLDFDKFRELHPIDVGPLSIAASPEIMTLLRSEGFSTADVSGIMGIARLGLTRASEADHLAGEREIFEEVKKLNSEEGQPKITYFAADMGETNRRIWEDYKTAASGLITYLSFIHNDPVQVKKTTRSLLKIGARMLEITHERDRIQSMADDSHIIVKGQSVVGTGGLIHTAVTDYNGAPSRAKILKDKGYPVLSIMLDVPEFYTDSEPSSSEAGPKEKQDTGGSFDLDTTIKSAFPGGQIPGDLKRGYEFVQKFFLSYASGNISSQMASLDKPAIVSTDADPAISETALRPNDKNMSFGNILDQIIVLPRTIDHDKAGNEN